MPLQQINLKVPESVAEHWKGRAAAAGLSVRDWLVSVTAPTAEVVAAGPADPEQAERLAQLEASVAELRQALALLRSPRPRRVVDLVENRPARAAAAPKAPSSVEGAPLPERPAGAIETSALADRLGVRRGTFNARISRLGGAVPGLVIDGWRCLGHWPPERGGPPRALWVPVED